MNIEEILKFLQENRILAGYAVVGVLFLILLIFLFIKSISARKQPALTNNAHPSMGVPTPKSSANLSKAGVDLPTNFPQFSIDTPSTNAFLAQLKQVSNESQKVIQKMEVEIADREKAIVEKTQYINQLEEQMASMPMEQILSQHTEKLKRESEKKIIELQRQAQNQRSQMWFIGFAVGILLSGITVVVYYFMFLKGN